jgi:hypothetical protein
MKTPSLSTLSGEINLRNYAIDVLGPELGRAERRSKARIKHPFPTRAWGADANGQAFEVDCALDNMSSSGLYLRMAPQMKAGSELNVVVKFSNGLDTGATAMLFGQILRFESGTDGLNGVAIAIKRHEFL